MGAHEGPRYERILAATPAGRFAETHELAGAALYLASPASDFVTGSVLVADGGLSLGGFARMEPVEG